MGNLIAVGVNRLDKIWHGHFGVSPYFQIYNAVGEIVDKRINPHGIGHEGKHIYDDDQHLLVKEILHDCKIFVGKRMGEGSQLKLSQKLGIETVLTEKSEPQEVVKEILNK